MIEEKNFQIKYLSFEQIQLIYERFYDVSLEMGEAVPEWNVVNKKEVQNLIALPQTTYYGVEQYPTLESKAAFLFYKINKGHIFPNGNKRLSAICLVVFLQINVKNLEVSPDELRDKSLELAQSDARDHAAVLVGLEQWIGDHIKNL